MRIYCHADLDGFASGAIMRKVYPNADIRLYNYSYDWYRSFGDVEPGEKLIFVDITPRKEELLNLLVITDNIEIIDHHPSAVRDLQAIGRSFPGVIDTEGLGACSLVWQYHFPKLQMPKAVQWIAEYDVWQRTQDNKRFQFGIQTFSTFPENRIWDRLLNDEESLLNYVNKTGKTLLEYLEPWYRRLVRSYAIEGVIEDHSAIFLNQGGVDSSVFDSIEGMYDIYLRGVIGKSGEWLLSMTTGSDNINVGVIAEQYGGGGHDKSAGCKVADLKSLFKSN